MKKYIILLLCVIAAIIVNAQTSGTPDSFGYKWINSKASVNAPAYKWFDITSIGTLVNGLSDDNYVGPFSDTNDFPFYWYGFNKFWIGSNGFVSFNGDNIASPFPASIPLSSGANNWVAPFLTDLVFTGTGNTAKCYYYFNKDTLCVSFIDVPYWDGSTGFTGKNTFQVIFSRADSSICFNYKSMDMGSKTSITSAIGIENITGTIGLGVLFDTEPDDLFTIMFDYPDTVTYQVKDGGMVWNDNNKNGGIFIKKSASAMKLKANVKNYGNQLLTNITIKDTIMDASGKNLSNGSASIYQLDKQEDTTVTFSNTFKATTAGTYTYHATIEKIKNDVVVSNDQQELEVIAIDTNSSQMILDYSDGSYEDNLNWTGGNGGVGVYFIPPIYPARVLATRFYIVSNASTPVGFYAIIYDDDGPDGRPGTLLDSVYVQPTSVTTGAYNLVYPANKTITILDGGVYVYWKMGGENISIGKDTDGPFSRRTYEVLYETWSEYRDILTEDFLIGLYVRYASPLSDFTFDDSNDPTVSFYENATYDPYKFDWDFDDNGAKSNLENPVHTFSTNGTHSVCLQVTGPGGKHKMCKNVVISNAAAIADFEADTSNDPQIDFIDQSLNTPTSWKWDFGDGSATSSMQNPSHTYANNGTYTICLIASNATGIDTICKDVTVRNVPPVADFSIDSLSDPLVRFTDLSISDPASWYWDFDDTGDDTSAMQNPVYTFVLNGKHKVCLTASNGGGGHTLCKILYINNAAPIADFSTDTSLNPEVSFTDMSLNDPTSWLWDFDDDGATSVIQNPTYVFKLKGKHKVCLKINNANGADSICKNILVSNAVPIADFSIDSIADPQIDFSDMSLNSPTSWLWDFDENGETSILQNASYTFKGNGMHKVCLIAANVSGSDTLCKSIFIEKASPIADFSFDPSLDPEILFSDLSKNSPTSWHWDFDHNGDTSILQNPDFTFTYNGDFNVCLTISSSYGQDSVCKTVTISNVIPVADFSIDSSNMPEVIFTDLSTGVPSSWYWDFDEGSLDTSSMQNPVFVFRTNGTHNVCLTATNSAGSSSPYCMDIVVSSAGVDEQGHEQYLLVYPNPFSEHTVIQLKSTTTYDQLELRCYNMLGDQLETDYTVYGNRIELNRRNLSKGSYFFEVYHKGIKIGKGRFVIQ